MNKYNPSQFDDIRPYYDSEIPAAMQRIVESDFFGLLCTYVYPGRSQEDDALFQDDPRLPVGGDVSCQRTGNSPFHHGIYL